MLNMPVGEIKKKIQQQTDLSLEQVNARVQEKMKELAGLVSEEGACHIVANEMKVELIPSADERKIADLLPGMRDVQQDMRVVQVWELRTFQSKYGDGEGKVCSFLGGDDSGVIRVTCWGEHADTATKLNQGDIVRVKNSYVKENNGRAELHMNNNSELLVNPEGVTVDAPQGSGGGGDREYVRKKISELTRGDYRVELLGTVVQVYDPRFFDKKQEEGQGAVVNILIDDGTGNIRCAAFNETAAQALGLPDLKTLVGRSDDTFDEERTDLLGRIVKVQGRAKLNTVYNSIEVNLDALDIDPDASAELAKTEGKTLAVAEGSGSAAQDKKSESSSAESEESAPAAPRKDVSDGKAEQGEKRDANAGREDAEGSGERKGTPQQSSAREAPQSEGSGDDIPDLDDLDDMELEDLDDLDSI